MYKTILVHVDDTVRVEERIGIAAKLAGQYQSHLVGAAMTGISHVLYQSGPFSYIDPVSMAVNLDFLSNRAERSLERFEQIVNMTEITSVEKRLIADEPGGGLSLQARYSDLVVIGQHNDDEPAASALNDFPEYVVLHGGRPVLIVPHTGHYPTLGSTVLIAWDASMEATHAVTNALPFLKRAEIVNVVVFNAQNGAQKQSEQHGEQPGADIALYLARHGVKVNVMQRSTGGSNIDIGNAILSCAADIGADLIVMGCYGHSRFREVLLGGVTRTILQSMTIPVLMSH